MVRRIHGTVWLTKESVAVSISLAALVFSTMTFYNNYIYEEHSLQFRQLEPLEQIIATKGWTLPAAVINVGNRQILLTSVYLTSRKYRGPDNEENFTLHQNESGALSIIKPIMFEPQDIQLLYLPMPTHFPEYAEDGNIEIRIELQTQIITSNGDKYSTQFAFAALELDNGDVVGESGVAMLAMDVVELVRNGRVRRPPMGYGRTWLPHIEPNEPPFHGY